MAPGRLLLQPRWLYRNGGVEEHRCVLVEGPRIVSVLDDTEAASVDAKAVALPTHLLLPGLVNAHTHVAAGPLARSIAEDVELAPGMAFYVPLSRIWQLAYGPGHLEDVRAIATLDVWSMLLSGTTLVVNQASVDLEGYLDIAESVGVRTLAGPILPGNVGHRLGTLVDGAARRDDLVGESEQAAELRRFGEVFSRHDGRAGGRIRMMLGPASAHTVGIEVLAETARVAAELGCPVTTHLCQAPSELEETRARYGMTPLEVLARAGLLNDRLICAHGTYLPDADLAPMAASGASIAHCASRKAREAIFTPLARFADAGIRVALGTDSFNADLLGELGMAATLGKLAVGSTARPSAAEVVEAATRAGADALGYGDLGRLEPGALADLIAVDLSSPSTWPVYDPLRALVYYGNGRDVDLVMVDGRILVEGGRPRHADLDGIRHAAEAATSRIWEACERSGLLPLATSTAAATRAG